jgi:hypothetical protein
MWEKLKSIIEDDNVFVGFLFVLVGFGSFGLGRMPIVETPHQASILSTPSAKIIDTQVNTGPGTSSTTAKNNDAESKYISSLQNEGQDVQKFVASKSGTKYHKLTCPGAKQIKETNKIFFATENDAESAGYSKAANCPDM